MWKLKQEVQSKKYADGRQTMAFSGGSKEATIVTAEDLGKGGERDAFEKVSWDQPEEFGLYMSG